MKITKVAVAGTLESSDVQVRVQPFDSLDIEINSSVAKQFGEDKGALDCVLQARVKTAAMRATDETINWEAVL